jgi:hypothetical protein
LHLSPWEQNGGWENEPPKETKKHLPKKPTKKNPGPPENRPKTNITNSKARAERFAPQFENERSGI